MLLAYGFPLKGIPETFEESSHKHRHDGDIGSRRFRYYRQHRALAAIVDDLKQFGTVTVDKDMVIICIVGDLEWTTADSEAKAPQALDDIPVRMISYGGSNYNISVLVRACDSQSAEGTQQTSLLI